MVVYMYMQPSYIKIFELIIALTFGLFCISWAIKGFRTKRSAFGRGYGYYALYWNLKGKDAIVVSVIYLIFGILFMYSTVQILLSGLQ